MCDFDRIDLGTSTREHKLLTCTSVGLWKIENIGVENYLLSIRVKIPNTHSENVKILEHKVKLRMKSKGIMQEKIC